MELRCKNCQARISVPSVGPLKEVQCPKCGVLMMLPPPKRRLDDAAEAAMERKHLNALRRVFDPIPRSVMYVAGLVFALALLSPFWAYLITGAEHKPIFLTDDAPSLPVPTHAAPASAPALMSTNEVTATDLAEYAGIRLETSHEELDRQFNFALQNTRGMQPEIYVAEPGDDIEQITAQFYDGILKEFTLVMRERLLAPEVIEKQLRDEFGQPSVQREADAAIAGLTGLGRTGDAVSKQLAAYPHRRVLTWADAKHQVEATLYFSDGPSPRPVTQLQIRLVAAEWLKNHPPLVGSLTPVPTNSLQPSLSPILPIDHKLAP